MWNLASPCGSHGSQFPLVAHVAAGFLWWLMWQLASILVGGGEQDGLQSPFVT